MWPHALALRFLCQWSFPSKTLEWVASSFSSRSFWPRGQTHVSCLAGRFFTTESPRKSYKGHNISQISMNVSTTNNVTTYENINFRYKLFASKPQNNIQSEHRRGKITSVFYCSLVDLQHCISFRCTAKWFNHICMYFFQIVFHYRSLQDIKYISLCYTLRPCYLSVLYIVVSVNPILLIYHHPFSLC